MKALIVVQPFGDYQRGSQITDPKAIEEILDSPQQSHVVKTELQDRAEEAPAQETAEQ